MPQFVGLSRKVRRKRKGILRSIEPGVSDARVETVSNKIKVAIRQGYGFRNIDNLVALVTLRRSDLRPELPSGTPRQGGREGGDGGVTPTHRNSRSLPFRLIAPELVQHV